MARIPYADPAATPDLSARIAGARGSVLHLYAMLLHSPPVAEGWLDYLTAIRHHCALPGAIRELVIIRIAHLNGAPYEAEQHVPIALREGVSEAQVAALAAGEGSGLFDQREAAALAYCDAMTREVHVSDAAFDAVRALFDERLVVELTATIAAYNMVSRFLEALRISSGDPL